MKRYGTRQSGVTLLEVLIAVVILGVGLVGIAALQITTQAYSESGLYRGQAAALARELVERMRVNLEETRDGSYDFNSLPSKTKNCFGSSKDCTPAQMKDYDLREWAARVNATLPGATATVATVAGSTSVDPFFVTVTMGWDESRGQRNAVSQAFTFRLFGLDLRE